MLLVIAADYWDMVTTGQMLSSSSVSSCHCPDRNARLAARAYPDDYSLIKDNYSISRRNDKITMA